MPDFFWIVMIAWGGMFLVFSVIRMICRTISDSIRAKRGDWDQNGNAVVPPMFERMLDRSMAERDEKYQALEERIRVLEQIVTDSHGKNTRRSLADEIESLRDKG